jgi:hypothetical protein
LKDEAEKLMKAANLTAAWQIKKKEEATVEKKRLDDLEYNTTKEENNAKANLLSAQKAEELAKTE